MIQSDSLQVKTLLWMKILMLLKIGYCSITHVSNLFAGIAWKNFGSMVLDFFERFLVNKCGMDQLAIMKRYSNSNYMTKKYIKSMNGFIEPEAIDVGGGAYQYISFSWTLPWILERHIEKGN